MSTETVPKGYKRTEVGVIPEEWEYLQLTTIARLESGHTPSRRVPKYWNGGIPWVSLHDTGSLAGREISQTVYTISVDGLNNSSARMLPKGTVIFSRTATVGKTAVLSRDMATSQDFANFICGPKIFNDFLVYLFRFMGPQWRTLMAGSIHNTVYMPTFISLKIIVPPLPEQEAIAAALSDADALIESLEQLVAKKRLIKQGAMQELLTGKRRLPGFTGKWETKRLGDIARIQRGASPRPIDNPEWFDDSSKIGWVRISDVTRSGIYLTETTQRLSEKGVAHSRPVDCGNLIMSICATVGRPIITKIDVCIHDGFVVFDGVSTDQFYLYYFLKWIEPNWSKQGQTGSQMNLNTGLINGTMIDVPKSLPEQSAIAAVLSDMDSEIEAFEGKLAKARLVKQGMMQQLLTGKVRLVSSQPGEGEVPFPVAAETTASKTRNQPFNEAVLISVLAGRYGTQQFPLSRFRYTKFLYLFHRHVDHVAQGFRKKAAGPYNPDNRYKGPETIAQKSGYMIRSGTGFVAGPKNPDALGYFEKWYPLDHLQWLDSFRFKRDHELEVLTTVDMACEDLRTVGKAISVQTVKALIESEPEWAPKLKRDIFSDTGIAAAIRQSQDLFRGNSA